jgi:hypothetical protein
MIATFADRHDGVQIFHRFAQKYCFKGVWDGAGKVVKAYIRDQERSLQQRFPDALTCFKKCRESLEIPKDRKPWEKWEEEKDPRILGKTNFVVSRRFFGFASDDKVQFDELREQYEHIVFTDRDNKPPAIPRVKDTLKVHSAANNPASRQPSADGGPDSYELSVGKMPCECLVCWGKINSCECPFQHIRREETLRVRATLKRNQRQSDPSETEALKLLEGSLRLKLGVDKVSCKILKNFLRSKNLPTSGRKLVLAERVGLFFERSEENPGEPPLAMDYIRDDSDLDDSDDDSDNESDRDE